LGILSGRHFCKEDPMNPSRMFRMSLPVVIAASALALAGCETMNSAWNSTKSFVAGGNVTLSGGEEVPPVVTSAKGGGTITVKDDKTVAGSITVTGMNDTAAHIHQAARGNAGPVIITLTKADDGSWTVPAGAKLTDAQYAAYKAGNLYVNVHSRAHKGGELRAQLKP
jgi:hypothetical protein